ncbi:glycosyl hydrolase 115 family protein [Granulicella aggregans]|uniref:glycosyl hydrolase 115 family protein n=1 Tax=Granulicella aggregans TaxID=474949 RepID=UPI001C8502CC|nr:glycosyl hydrolase 115 family protein [Granulicella aggregans]
MSSVAHATDVPVAVCHKNQQGTFGLIHNNRPAAILIDVNSDSAVQHVASSFADDLRRVSGHAPLVVHSVDRVRGPLVVMGVLHHSVIIDELAQKGMIQVADLDGRWEAFRQIIVEHPFPNVPQALVIVGSDRRGVVYGAYDISERIGVSPWYWFADVPVERRSNLFLSSGSRRDQPKVKYRGFFINDENPGFNTWALKHFGGINARMYEHVFELDLRLKGNFLWPAMWAPKAFADDDPQNMVLADAMGLVMGTSHHEAMMRAQDEWHRHTDGGVTGGKWDYSTNAANLQEFWRGGIERMMSKGDGTPHESLVTIGMRGDGDEPMAEGTATRQLETIVADQRKIIADVTRKPASQTPQVWALYKEVQDYYDHGMKVPDDVTLLFSDDNWGQLRRLPEAGAERAGGYGIYYHFDYVGLPRNYKWINTNQIEKTWQQMDLAYASGAKQLWIVNVGDIKPMEFPLSFFMKQAWNPEAMNLEALNRYPEEWAREAFGSAQAAAIAHLVTRYSQLAARRKPELIDADSFVLGGKNGSALDGGEFGMMIGEWEHLEREVRDVKPALREDQRDAFFELIEHPILALSNLYHLYYAVAWNHRLAPLGDARANFFADRAEAAFRRDKEITNEYHAVQGGKWDGMMLQTHIGYTGWQQPDTQEMPPMKRVAGAVADKAIVFTSPEPEEEAANASQADVIAIEPQHYARAIGGKGLTWQTIPNLGRTLGAVIALPQGRASTTPGDGVHLEYDVALRNSGTLAVQLMMAPTLDTTGKGTLQIGLSVDDGPVQVLSDHLVPAPSDATTRAQFDWNKAVEDNCRVLEAQFTDIQAGPHVIKVWRIDDNEVLEKVVVSNGPIPASYLGPPETKTRFASK